MAFYTSGVVRAACTLAVISMLGGCAALGWIGLGKNTQVVVVEAENFSAEANGSALKRNDRPGTSNGMCISSWDNDDHLIEWNLDVPQSGKYAVVVRYAGGRNWNVYRDIKINDKVPAEAFKKITLVTTGGFGTKPEQWVNLTVSQDGKPVLIDLPKGRQKLTMNNLGSDKNSASGNLDMVAFIGADADIAVTLRQLEAAFPKPAGLR